MPQTGEITDSNRQDHEDIHAEVHECLRLLRKLDGEFERWRPVLTQFAVSPVAGFAAARRARKNGHDSG